MLCLVLEIFEEKYGKGKKNYIYIYIYKINHFYMLIQTHI